VPLGALARLSGEELHLNVRLCALDGSQSLRGEGAAGTSAATISVEDAIRLGERVARELLARGAASLIASERDARAVDEP
jgi:porphobilinogen deaminase